VRNFVDDGKRYQPIALRKQYAENISEFEALYLSEDVA
jgi:hypothetical protein